MSVIGKNSESDKKLEALRERLRGVDDEIVRQVVRRMAIVRDIGSLKRTSGMEILDLRREAFNKQRSRDVAGEDLPGVMVDELTDLLANWAREIQKMSR